MEVNSIFIKNAITALEDKRTPSQRVEEEAIKSVAKTLTEGKRAAIMTGNEIIEYTLCDEDK